MSSFAAVYALVYAADAANSTREQIRLSERGQISERFDRAIEQLGSANLDVRLGAIYALDRAMRDSPSDVPTVVEVLSGYVRRRASVAGQPSTDPLQKATTEIQAAVTVLGRRPRASDVPVDFTGADLSATRLSGLNFVRGRMSSTDLHGVDMSEADLTGTDLNGANLANAHLTGANLTRAQLSDADLQRSDLTQASMVGAKLSRAKLNAATLDLADLTNASLDQADMQKAAVFGATFQHASLDGANLSTVVDAQPDQFNDAFEPDPHAQPSLPAGVRQPTGGPRPRPTGGRYAEYVPRSVQPAASLRSNWYLILIPCVLLAAAVWLLRRRFRRRPLSSSRR